MIRSVTFMSRHAAETTPPAAARSTALIAFDTPGRPPSSLVIPPEWYARTWRVCCHDLCEERAAHHPTLPLPPQAWGPEASPYTVNGVTCHIPNMTHARILRAALEHLAADPKPWTLVVHCEAGVSRSAAVALFVSQHYHCPLVSAVPVDGANPRLLRLLHAAYGERPRGTETASPAGIWLPPSDPLGGPR